MGVGMTHTYAILDVPPVVYAAVRALVTQAEYEDAIQADTEGEVIDMHGLALRATAGPIVNEITIRTVIRAKDQQRRIECSLNGESTQMNLDTARKVVEMLHEAIDAARGVIQST